MGTGGTWSPGGLRYGRGGYVRSGHVVFTALDVHWTSIHYCSHGVYAATVPFYGGRRGYVVPIGLRYGRGGCVRSGGLCPPPFPFTGERGNVEPWRAPLQCAGGCVRSGHVVFTALDVHWTSIHYCSHGVYAATVPVAVRVTDCHADRSARNDTGMGRGYVEPIGLRYSRGRPHRASVP